MKGQLSNAVANELLTKRPEQRYSVSRLSASSQETASTDGPIGLIITGGTIGSEIKNGDLTDTEGKADGAAAESFLLPWNNAAALDAVLTAYEAEVAAVLMEPICINGGGVRPTRDTLDEVRRLCDAHGVVLIFDGVIVGFRVGLGGAQLLYGVIPDLTTLGKALGGGALPVSAVAGRRDIMALYETRTVVQEKAPALHGVEALFFVLLLHSPD